MPPVLKPDPVALQLAPGGKVTATAVTFRGWLSAKDDGTPISGDVYRFFTSPWFDEWLEIGTADLLYQQHGSTTSDGSSIIWVRRDATISKCRAAQACSFAEEEAELGADPTAANPTAAKYPRY